MNKTDEMIAKVRSGDPVAVSDLARYIEALELQISEVRDLLNLTPEQEVLPVLREKLMLYGLMMQVTQIQHEQQKRDRWAGNPLFAPKDK